MDGKTRIERAVILHGSCDLTGRPCLPGIHLIQSFGRATGSVGEALPDDFHLEAEVEIGTCQRACRLSLKAGGGSLSVCRGAVLLAACGERMPIEGHMRLAEPADAAAPVRRAH